LKIIYRFELTPSTCLPKVDTVSFHRRSDGGLPRKKEKTMSRTMNRIALAAVLSTLSAPAFAADTTSAIAGDPTWPAIENPAPAIVVNHRGNVEALRADPTFPATDNASPALALVAVPDEGPTYQPAETWETPSVALATGSAEKSEQLAAVR
jgi:hypothetical protein